jgi:ankyrin repeat protein
MKTFALLLFLFLACAASAQAPQEILDALQKADIQTIKALVGKTPQLAGARDRDSMTPLHYAPMGGNAD